ncbi:MAG: bis(5'-nucleosyl)-tetraphosphatase (symmetrical) [Leptothrix sp. (in: Bacteria)]|nr:bis(5'-nucleosyl)-tetraphosphatase (symmetrical) [Leptothrix sp. (in: b-proteobacteria)]
MIYLIGDVQGCAEALRRVLDGIGFTPSRDRLVLLGDLVNRGPDSLGVLRLLAPLAGAAICLLGNHDLHLLAVAHGVRKRHAGDTFGDVLAAPDRDAWLDWVREQPLAHLEAGWLCVHAGVVPQWSRAQTLALAAEVQTLLRGPDLPGFLQVMYGNQPDLWRDDLSGADRTRLVINTLTRIRFCSAEGRLDFKAKEGAGAAPPGLMPWFDVPGRATAGQPMAFGHWSTLGLVNRADLLAIDTGCVWGGTLTAVRVDGGRRDVMQLRCEQTQVPGA